MRTIIITDNKMNTLFESYKFMFMSFINSGEVYQINWEEDGHNLSTALPSLISLIQDGTPWQAIVIFGADKIVDIDNPFDFIKGQEGNIFYKEKPESIVKLTYFLTGLPAHTPIEDQNSSYNTYLENYPRININPPSKTFLLYARNKLESDVNTIKERAIRNTPRADYIAQGYHLDCRYLYFNISQEENDSYKNDIFNFFANVLALSINRFQFGNKEHQRVFMINTTIDKHEIQNAITDQIKKIFETKEYISNTISSSKGILENPTDINLEPSRENDCNLDTVPNIRTTLQNLITQKGNIVLSEDLVTEINKRIKDIEDSITNSKIEAPPEKKEPLSPLPQPDQPKEWETEIKPEIKEGLSNTMVYTITFFTFCFILMMIYTKLSVLSLVCSVAFFALIYFTGWLKHKCIINKEFENYEEEQMKLERERYEAQASKTEEKSKPCIEILSTKEYFKKVHDYMYWQSLKVRAKQFKEAKEAEISFLKTQEEVLENEKQKYLNIGKLFNITIDVERIKAELPTPLPPIDLSNGIPDNILNLEPLPANTDLTSNNNNKYRQPYKFISKIEFTQDGPLY